MENNEEINKSKISNKYDYLGEIIKVLFSGVWKIIWDTISVFLTIVFHIVLLIFIFVNIDIHIIPFRITIVKDVKYAIFILLELIVVVLLFGIRKFSLKSTLLFICIIPRIILVSIYETMKSFTFPIVNLLLLLLLFVTFVLKCEYLQDVKSIIVIVGIMLNLLSMFHFTLSDLFSGFGPVIDESLNSYKRRIKNNLDKYVKDGNENNRKAVFDEYSKFDILQATIYKYVGITALTSLFSIIFFVSLLFTIFYFGLLYKEMGVPIQNPIGSIYDYILLSISVITANIPEKISQNTFKIMFILEFVVGIYYLTLIFSLFFHVSTDKLEKTRKNQFEKIKTCKKEILEIVGDKISLSDSKYDAGIGDLIAISLLAILNYFIDNIVIKKWNNSKNK